MTKLWWRQPAICAAVAIGLYACARAEDAPPPADAPATTEAAQPGSYTRADFDRLRFLDGAWRGTMPDGQPFFERYRITSDSTIQMYALADSTLTTPTDSSLIYWRDHHIYSESATSRYVVTQIDSSGIRFTPERGGRNEFTWKPTAEGWMATLQWTDQAGQPKSVVYEMRRIN